MKIKKYLFVFYFFALNLCTFGAESNFINLKNILSGVWCNEILNQNVIPMKKIIFFHAFYEYSPNIIASRTFCESPNDINTSPISVLLKKGFGGYNSPMRSAEALYFYDKILDVFYSWNGYQKHQLSVVFDPKKEKIYSLQLTKENLERLKSIRKYGKGLEELSDYADSVVWFSCNKADAILNEDLVSRKRRGNLIFYTLLPLQKPLEKIASSFDVRAYMNADINRFNPGEMQNFRKRLISYLGECTLEFSGKRELRVYVNLSDCLSMTYYDRNIDSSLSNMNRTAIDLLAPNGISKEQERGEKYYYYVPFTKLRVRYAVNDSFLIYYTSEQWIKDNPESDFRNEKHAYIGKEDKDGNFIFYSGKEAAQDIKDLCNTNEYGHIISMKKDLEPRFKMKFGENEIIMWILRDGKWHQNFRMTRVLGGK